MSFSPDGSRLAYGGVDTKDPKSALCLVSLAPSDLQGTAQPDCTPTGFDTFALAYTANGAIMSGGRDGAVRLRRRPLPHAGGMSITGQDVWGLSPDGRLIAAPRAAAAFKSPTSIGIWDASASGDPVLDGTLRLSSMPQMVTFLRPTVLLTVAHDGAVRLWDLHDAHHPARAASLGTVDFPTEPTGLGDAILSPGVTADPAGDLVSVQRGGRLVLWRVAGAFKATEAGSIPVPDATSDIAGLVDSRTACVLTTSGIDWWDVTDPGHPVHGATSAVHAANRGSLTGTHGVAAATNGVSGNGTALSLFALSGGRPRSTVALPGAIGSALGLSNDGRVLAAAGAGDDTVTLWDIHDPVHPHALGTTSTLPGTTGFAFAPSDRLMADWSGTGSTVQVWSIHGSSSSPALLATLTPPADTTAQISATFSPTRGVLAIAGYDSVVLYGTDPTRLATAMCSYTGALITSSQWKKYAPGVAYRHPCPTGH